MNKEIKIAICSLIIAGILVPIGIKVWDSYNINKAIEREDTKERKNAQPQIEYVDYRYEDGYTFLTFRNKSTVTPVAITQSEFVISDPQTLKRIKRKHPKPARNLLGNPNPINDISFTDGYWKKDGSYAFLMSLGIHIPPSELNDIRLAIVNSKWSKKSFVGTLNIDYSSDNPAHNMLTYTLESVTIKGRRQR